MQTCKECGANFPEEMSSCPACGEQVPKAEEETVQIPKQYPKQYPKQLPRESSIFEEKPAEEPVDHQERVIICPKCGSENVYLMENRAPTEREKNVLMACTHCRRTFHGPAFYDSKILSRRKGARFFLAMAILSAVGFGVLLATGQATAFLPGTVLGGVALAVSAAGVVLYRAKASYWKSLQGKCYKSVEKGGAK